VHTAVCVRLHRLLRERCAAAPTAAALQAYYGGLRHFLGEDLAPDVDRSAWPQGGPAPAPAPCAGAVSPAAFAPPAPPRFQDGRWPRAQLPGAHLVAALLGVQQAP
jgi:hypothetical protein